MLLVHKQMSVYITLKICQQPSNFKTVFTAQFFSHLLIIRTCTKLAIFAALTRACMQ